MDLGHDASPDEGLRIALRGWVDGLPLADTEDEDTTADELLRLLDTGTHALERAGRRWVKLRALQSHARDQLRDPRAAHDLALVLRHGGWLQADKSVAGRGGQSFWSPPQDAPEAPASAAEGGVDE